LKHDVVSGSQPQFDEAHFEPGVVASQSALLVQPPARQNPPE
jgi:hypothetical protein